MLLKYLFIALHVFVGPFVCSLFFVLVFNPQTALDLGVCVLGGFVLYMLYMSIMLSLLGRWDKEESSERK